MGGSKKGERRGNARKRAAAPAGAVEPPKRNVYRERTRAHETPGEIMDEAVRMTGPRHLEHAVIERRIQVARVINGPSNDINDITPKEAMLMAMRFHLQGIRDTELMLNAVAEQPVSDGTTASSDALIVEMERLYDKMGDFAFKVAGYIHPKLQAQATVPMAGLSEMSVLQALFDEVNELEQNRPVLIEHKPSKVG